MLELLKADIKPLDIMTRAAFENAMTIVMALGGSTNAVLHLLAMARACGVPLTLDDFQACSDRTPFIADLKPSGKFVMEDVHKVRRSRETLVRLRQRCLCIGKEKCGQVVHVQPTLLARKRHLGRRSGNVREASSVSIDCPSSDDQRMCVCVTVSARHPASV